MHKVELLAPAGNFECLIAAVQSGADAVYLAGKSFGARSFADNFENEKLAQAVDYCHLRGVKLYVTVNTLVLDSETEELKKYLIFLSEIGVDAIIVQDMGVLELARKIVPDLPVHASTQMTIHNLQGVLSLARFGIKRVVLSRELSLDDIRYIAENTDMELEVFAHGALCMCYSGQCLLSSIIGSRSGNRGKCAQPCRLQYGINSKKEKKYYMSLKDLSSLEHLKGFLAAGVASLKIEGRMKGPAYVAAVVGIYRRYLDSPAKIRREDMELLDSIFNRGGLTDGYLTGKTGPEMFALDKPDNPYRKGSSEIEKQLLGSLKAENRKIRIFGKITIQKDSFPKMTVSCGNISVEYVHEKLPEQAMKAPIDAPSVLVQMAKTGGTTFEFEDVSASVDEGLFLSAGELNKIRRNALAMFEKVFVASFKRTAAVSENEKCDVSSVSSEGGFVCEVTNLEQLETAKKYDFKKFLVPIGLIRKNSALTDGVKEKIIIVLPAILRDGEFEKYVADTKSLLDSGYHGVSVHNIALIESFEGYKVYGSFRLNIFNSPALKVFKDLKLEAAEFSPELTLRQIDSLEKPLPTQVMVYGRLPLMVSENCIIRNGSSCPCKGDNTITDRMGMKFPVIKDGDICRSVVLNCKKTFMGFEMEKIKKAGVNFFRIYFTDEAPEECDKICDTFLCGGDYRPEDFTKGHFYKGVAN